MSGKSDSEAIEKIYGWIIDTPVALATIFFSYISGHMWSYLIFTYAREKKHSKGFFDNKTGKVSLGLLWHALVALPIYCYHYQGFYGINYETYLAVGYNVIMAALFLQGIIFCAVTLFARAN